MSATFRTTRKSSRRRRKELTLCVRPLEHVLQDLEATLVPLTRDDPPIDPIIRDDRRRHRGLVARSGRRVEHADTLALALLLEEAFVGVGEDGGQKNPGGHAGGFVLGEEAAVLIGGEGGEGGGCRNGEQRFDVGVEGENFRLGLAGGR